MSRNWIDYFLVVLVFGMGFLGGMLYSNEYEHPAHAKSDTTTLEFHLRIESHPDTVEQIAKILANSSTPDSVDRYVAQKIYGTAYWYPDIDPLMVARLIYIESRNDSLAISPIGAVGLGQIRPEIWSGRFPECGDDLRRVRSNICYTVSILHYYQNLSPSWREALLLFNGCKSSHCRWYARAVSDADYIN